MTFSTPSIFDLGQVCDFAEVRVEEIEALAAIGDAPPLSDWEKSVVPATREWLGRLSTAKPDDIVRMAATTLEEDERELSVQWCLSTGHIRPETNALLTYGFTHSDYSPENFLYRTFPEGYYITLLSDPQCHPTGLPDELQNIVDTAIKIGVGLLVIVGDGPECPDFSTFDW